MIQIGSGASMLSSRQSIPIRTAARDASRGLASIIHEVSELIAELDATELSAGPDDRQQETCAALWAAIVISIDSSDLSPQERAVLCPAVFAFLEPVWRNRRLQEGSSLQVLSQAQKYLAHRDPRSSVATAAAIVTRLLDALHASDTGRQLVGRRLSALLAHRMLGNTYRLNEMKLRFQIRLVTESGPGMPA